MISAKERICLRAIKKGKNQGLVGLFDLYKQPIFYFCMSLLKDKAIAEEATADVFIKIWEKRALIDASRTIKPFLYKIARDSAYSHLRKIASNERLRQRFVENFPSVTDRDGQWEYLAKERMGMVEAILNDLPPKRKMIFRMKYLEGKNNKDIADHLKLSIHTVKSQLVKARSHVREALESLDRISICILLGIILGL